MIINDEYLREIIINNKKMSLKIRELEKEIESLRKDKEMRDSETEKYYNLTWDN